MAFHGAADGSWIDLDAEGMALALETSVSTVRRQLADLARAGRVELRTKGQRGPVAWRQVRLGRGLRARFRTLVSPDDDARTGARHARTGARVNPDARTGACVDDDARMGARVSNEVAIDKELIDFSKPIAGQPQYRCTSTGRESTSTASTHGKRSRDRTLLPRHAKTDPPTVQVGLQTTPPDPGQLPLPAIGAKRKRRVRGNPIAARLIEEFAGLYKTAHHGVIYAAHPPRDQGVLAPLVAVHPEDLLRGLLQGFWEHQREEMTAKREGRKTYDAIGKAQPNVPGFCRVIDALVKEYEQEIQDETEANVSRETPPTPSPKGGHR